MANTYSDHHGVCTVVNARVEAVGERMTGMASSILLRAIACKRQLKSTSTSNSGTQGAQYPLSKESSLNDIRDPSTI